MGDAQLGEAACATGAGKFGALRGLWGGKEEEAGGGNDLEALFWKRNVSNSSCLRNLPILMGPVSSLTDSSGGRKVSVLLGAGEGVNHFV